jgi:hypothetical protein
MRIEENEQYFVETDDRTITYMYDKINNIKGNFDFRGRVTDSKNIVIYSKGITITNCNDIIVGENNVGNLYGSDYITIGNDNEVSITKCSSVSIGNNNIQLELNELKNSSIGDRNNKIVGKGSYNIVGSDNQNVTINGDNNTVHNDNNSITTISNNRFDRSSYVELSNDCLFNEVTNSSLVTLNNATSNSIDTSKQININSTNNNNLFTKDLEVTNKNPFQKYYDNKGNRIVQDLTLNRNTLADSQAIQLDTKDNTNPQVKISKHNYYIDTNKLWALKEEGNVTQYTLEILPNPKSDYTTVSGNGTYQYNDTVRLYANVYNQSKMFSHWVLCDSEGKELEVLSNENPYYFQIKDNMYIYAQIKDKIN